MAQPYFNKQHLAGNFPRRDIFSGRYHPCACASSNSDPAPNFSSCSPDWLLPISFCSGIPHFPPTPLSSLRTCPLLLVCVPPLMVFPISRVSSLFLFSQPPTEGLLSPLKHSEYSVPFHFFRRSFWKSLASILELPVYHL